MRRYNEKSEHHEDREERHEKPNRNGAMAVQSALLQINQQGYDAPVSSSNSTSRQQMTFPFNPQGYQNVNSSTQASCIINSGSNLINPATSSIIFDVKFNGAVDDLKVLAWSFGGAVNGLSATPKSGSSACNLFQESYVRLRGGEIPIRVVDSNVLNAAIAPFKKGVGAENLFGETGSASFNTKYGAYKFPLWYCTDTVQFEIPLSKLFPGSFFGEASPCPPSLISGATIYLKFANMLQSMCFYTVAEKPVNSNGRPPADANPVPTTPVGITFNVENMQLMLDSMTVIDSSLALINAKASSLASSGLQYDYLNVWSNRTTLVTGSANIDLMVK